MTVELSVNLNAVALLRNRRDLPWPSVAGLGRIALKAGAHGLTVHPRPDQRHIRFSDLGEIRALLDSEFPGAEFNIEGYPSEDFLALLPDARPDQVTLVPDDPTQATSDHGWDFGAHRAFLTDTAARLHGLGARVSLFADPDPRGLEIAAEVGTDRVEFYTGPYGGTFADPAAAARELDRLEAAGNAARGAGLQINAGHDLTVANLPALVARIPDLAEVSIGNGLTADALEYGMAETVRRFCRACGQDA